MTPDGRYLAYLARPESEAYQSVFVVDLDTGDIRTASPTNDDSALNGWVVKLQIADDGKTVTYVSAATNIDSDGVPLPVREDGDPPPVSFIARLLVVPAPPQYRVVAPATTKMAAN